MAPHSSTLAWKIPWMEEPRRLRSMGSLRAGHDWATSLSLLTFTHWRRKWQPTPVFLPGESQGRGSLVGCRLWGRTESDTTEWLSSSSPLQFCCIVLLKERCDQVPALGHSSSESQVPNSLSLNFKNKFSLISYEEWISRKQELKQGNPLWSQNSYDCYLDSSRCTVYAMPSESGKWKISQKIKI